MAAQDIATPLDAAPAKVAPRGSAVNARRVAPFVAVGLVAFLLGGVIALQPSVRQMADASGLTRSLSLDAAGAAQIDLTPVSLNAPATLVAGQPISVTWTVNNLGGSPVDTAYFDGLFLSTTQTFDGGSIPLGTFNIQNNVSSGGSYSHTATVQIPTTVTPGTYFLFLRSDVFQTVTDLNRGNNDRALRVTVTR